MDKSISILRFLGIVAVVFGHIGFSISGKGSDLHTIIYFYHMPLFFFISGYLYKQNTFKNTIIKSIKGLYIPFVICSLIFICLRDVFISLGYYRMNTVAGLNGLISQRTLIDVFSFRYHEPLLGAMWFIPCLFIVRILYFLIDKAIEKIKFTSDSKDILLPLIIGLLFVYGLNLGINKQFLRYQLDVVFVAILFYYLGIQYKIYKEYIPIKFSIAIPLLIIMWQNIRFGFIDLNNRSYVNAAFLIFNALSGIYINFALVRVLQGIRSEWIKKSMYKIGQSTFWILVLNFVIFKVITHIKLSIDNMSRDYLQYIFPGDVIGLSWVWLIIYTVIGVLVPVVLESIKDNLFLLIKRMFRLKKEFS